MAALVHKSLIKCQALPLRAAIAPASRGLLDRTLDTLRLWRRRARQRRELAGLTERELRDIRLSSADAWHEIRKAFWQ